MRYITLTTLLLLPFALFGETIKGVVSGAVCGVHGMVCKHEPGEHGFELLGIYVDGDGFYYVANVPQKVLRKVNRKEVEIEGKLYKDKRTIVADKIKADKVIWVKGKKKH